MSYVTFSMLICWLARFDFFIFRSFLWDKGDEYIIFENGIVKGRVLFFSECDLYDFHELIVEHVIHLILFHEIDDDFKEILSFSYYLLAI